MSKTIDYYNTNADTYYTSTVALDMSAQYAFFEKHLAPGAHILDLGCGSGRDSKHFLECGYRVTAVDGSKELCAKAQALTGLPVRNLLFQDLDYVNQFDGVWACASLLHVRAEELPLVLLKVANALKEGGVLYASFKYGRAGEERDGRYYTDMDEEGLQALVKTVPGVVIEEVSISGDMQNRSQVRWLNMVVIKETTIEESMKD